MGRDDSSYNKVRGGKMVFKGGEELAGVRGGVKKKKSRKKRGEAAEGAEGAEAAAGERAVGIGGAPGKGQEQTYEELFHYETKRMEKVMSEGGVVNFNGMRIHKAPEILHGYTETLSERQRKRGGGGLTSEERLDLRSAVKHDKFCK
eukprot:CAMPEP_0170145788 /NCGR_PEP_ID=MMETSP0033_2-20121228/25496_1 /TAXON_ID=195969 /ORGANISM="Dolichomastix tenuilepis, Strain CCMP3274" /LENGTH=146 /DNA_ID=CAMNT_0010382419 /DNA_START=26 /DNA_END=466 /DNA_ORIENTATION=+